MTNFTRSVALGLKIVVEDTNATYHTIDNWGLAIANTDYIKAPETETAFIDIPFTDGFIDVSEAVSGRTTYKSRALNIKIKGIKEVRDWDGIISDIRNKIHGKICKLSFDNDRDHFWRGRVSVDDFTRSREAGYFMINVTKADPYKYNWQAYGEPWIWDIFNFRSGIIYSSGDIVVNGTRSITVPAGVMPVMPTFNCSNVNNLTVSDGKTTVTLTTGTNKDPRIEVNGSTAVVLTFTGQGTIKVTFRGGSL